MVDGLCIFCRSLFCHLYFFLPGCWTCGLLDNTVLLCGEKSAYKTVFIFFLAQKWKRFLMVNSDFRMIRTSLCVSGPLTWACPSWFLVRCVCVRLMRVKHVWASVIPAVLVRAQWSLQGAHVLQQTQTVLTALSWSGLDLQRRRDLQFTFMLTGLLLQLLHLSDKHNNFPLKLRMSGLDYSVHKTSCMWRDVCEGFTGNKL